MAEIVRKNFDSPEETRNIPKGKVEVINLGDMQAMRATFEPGWKWSEHVSPIAGTEFCEVGHVGIVISGKATAAMKDGEVYELGPGTIFHVPAAPHDSWVVGDEPYVSLHFLGADSYTK